MSESSAEGSRDRLLSETSQGTSLSIRRLDRSELVLREDRISEQQSSHAALNEDKWTPDCPSLTLSL